MLVDSGNQDVVKVVRAVRPAGMEVAIDCTGNVTVLPQALKCLRSPGRYFLVGVPAPGSRVQFDSGRLFGRTLSGIVEGDSYPPVGLPRLVELWRRGTCPSNGWCAPTRWRPLRRPPGP